MKRQARIGVGVSHFALDQEQLRLGGLPRRTSLATSAVILMLVLVLVPLVAGRAHASASRLAATPRGLDPARGRWCNRTYRLGAKVVGSTMIANTVAFRRPLSRFLAAPHRIRCVKPDRALTTATLIDDVQFDTFVDEEALRSTLVICLVTAIMRGSTLRTLDAEAVRFRCVRVTVRRRNAKRPWKKTARKDLPIETLLPSALPWDVINPFRGNER